MEGAFAQKTANVLFGLLKNWLQSCQSGSAELLGEALGALQLVQERRQTIKDLQQQCFQVLIHWHLARTRAKDVKEVF